MIGDPSEDREFLRRFGRRLKILRVERDLSQEQFGEVAGMHRTFIGAPGRARAG